MSDVRFARIPRRLTLALERGEVTLHEYALMAYLVARADHLTRIATFPSLTALSHGARWDLSDQALRRDLKRLKARGEIDYDTRQGKRGAYDIHICQADYFEKPSRLQHDFKQNTPSNFEVTSTRTPLRASPNPQQQREVEGSQLQHPSSPIDVAVDEDVDKEPEEAEAGTEETAEVFTEWKIDPDPPDRMAALVAQFASADDATLEGFRREFGQLSRGDYEFAVEILGDRPADDPLRNDAAYIRRVFRSRGIGRNAA